MRAVLSWVALLAVVILLAVTSRGGGLNGSTDGRYHTCGYITTQGVTSYLGAYRDRCH